MHGYDPMFDDEVLDECDECGKALTDDNMTGFCCKEHETVWVERQRSADRAYAEALADEAKYANEWRAAQRRERERGLPAADTFVIPDRLTPSTGIGLMMTSHFMRTPPKERV